MHRFTKSRWMCIIILMIFTLFGIKYDLSRRCRNSILSKTKINFETVHTNFRSPTDYFDLRIIVITFNRPSSLMRLLKSLNNANYGNDSVLLNVWIDRARDGSVHNETVSAARAFIFHHGYYTVNIHSEHVGIYGQWINTWVPKKESKEIAVILEDDLTVSPYFYNYLKLVHQKYDNQPRINGYSLQGVSIRHSDAAKMLNVTDRHAVFLYPTIGSWGFSPNRLNWFRFVDWYNSAKQQNGVVPSVPNNIATTWYKELSRQGKANTMWTIWHIYFAWKNNEFTLYPNFKGHKGLTYNWLEAGLHYQGKSVKDPNVAYNNLVQDWDSNFYNFLPSDPIKVSNTGDYKDT